jgi:serine/threonine protein kinase
MYLSQSQIQDHKEPLPTNHKLWIAIQVAEGLAHIHGKNIVHRDLALRNVMINTTLDIAKGTARKWPIAKVCSQGRPRK